MFIAGVGFLCGGCCESGYLFSVVGFFKGKINDEGWVSWRKGR